MTHTFAPPRPESAQQAASRLVRDAVRAGNQMIAGAAVAVLTTDPPPLTGSIGVTPDVSSPESDRLARELRALVVALGGRLIDPGDAAPDLVWIIAQEPHDAFPAHWWRPGTRLPALVAQVSPAGAYLTPAAPASPLEVVPAQRAALTEWRTPDDRRLAMLTDPRASRHDTGGAARMSWALRGMPSLRRLIHTHRETLSGARVLVSLLLEPKTAALALALAEAGVEVAVFAPAHETDPAVAAALHERGVTVFAPREPLSSTVRENADTVADHDRANACAALEWRPHWIMDDGAHVIRLAHTEHREALRTLRGAAEETTSGVRPLREMAADEALQIPVMTVNDAATKTGFDNRVGTGESCLMAVVDALGASPEPGTPCVIYGYGPVGQGTARAARALGYRVAVIEPDTVRALTAAVDGFETGSTEELLPQAALVISATGVWHTVVEAHLSLLPDGASVAVAGGIDNEIALDELSDAGWVPGFGGDDIHGGADATLRVWTAPSGNTIRMIADGAGVNYTAGEGNPLEVMDLSFATQVAALLELMRPSAPLHADGLPPGVHPLPPEREQDIARAALEARGMTPVDSAPDTRVGGARQPWTVHRFRAGVGEAPGTTTG